MDQFDGGWWLLDQDIQRGSGERRMFKAREEGLSFRCDGPCARSGCSPDVRFPLIATVLQTSLEVRFVPKTDSSEVYSSLLAR